MIHAVKLTAAAFARYGTVLDMPATGRSTPIPVLANLRPSAAAMVTLMRLPHLPPRFEAMERHRHSGQCFLNLGGGRLLVVVAPDAGGAPDLARVEAFLAAPDQGFDYAPGTWHAGVASIDGPSLVAALLCRDGTPDDVEVAPVTPQDVAV
jgi:ureidoglycolate lyase